MELDGSRYRNHWWWQRVTAVCLVPFSLWFALRAKKWLFLEHQYLLDVFSDPLTALGIFLFIVFSVIHGCFGLETIVYDYIQSDKNKRLAFTGILFLKWLVIVSSLFAMVVVFVGR